MKILVVDDDLSRHEVFKENLANISQLTPVYTYSQAVNQLEKNKFDIVFLDYDLNEYPEADRDFSGYQPYYLTGNDIAKKLVTMKNKPNKVIVHSKNPQGSRDILNTLRKSGISAEKAEYGFEDLEDVFKELKGEVISRVRLFW